MAGIQSKCIAIGTIDRFCGFSARQVKLWVEEYECVDTNQAEESFMPNWGQAKRNIDSQTEAEKPEKKRRKEDEPDGPASQAVQYLKMGFMPTAERLKAEEAYEREQERKREKQKDK